MDAMTSRPLSFDYISPPFTYLSSKQPQFPIPLPKIQSWHKYRAKNILRIYCSFPQTNHSDKEKQINQTKKKRKPRPSFVEQVQGKWSIKPTSLREKLPWQQGNSVSIEDVVEQQVQFETGENLVVNESVSSSSRVKVNLAPWVHGKQPKKSLHDESSTVGKSLEHSEHTEEFDFYSGKDEKDIKLESEVAHRYEIQAHKGDIGKGSTYVNDFIRLPWEGAGGDKLRKSNAQLAEKLIPEAQLKRLRNSALGMVERIKVGSAGVTQELLSLFRRSGKWMRLLN